MQVHALTLLAVDDDPQPNFRTGPKSAPQLSACFCEVPLYNQSISHCLAQV